MKQIVFSLILMVSAVSVQAQQEYVWDTYDIAFTLADDFEETANDEDEFSADGDGMSISIIPFDNADIDENDITSYTISIFASMDLERTDDINLIELNGFKGAYAEGASDDARLFIMGLIDPDSDTNFFVIITFLDDDQNAVDEAIRICKSIHRI